MNTKYRNLDIHLKYLLDEYLTRHSLDAEDCEYQNFHNVKAKRKKTYCFFKLDG